MTKNLARFLTNLFELIKDWNAGLIPTEKEFIDKLKKAIADIVAELGNQKEENIQTKI